MKYDDSRGFYFSMSKDFSINKELPRVNFVKCAMQTRYGNNVKIEPQHERLSRKFLPGDSPSSEIMTPPRFIDFFLKDTFFLNNSGAFKDFGKFFYGNVRLNV